MSYNKIVTEYIKEIPEDEPIFISEIKEYVNKYCKEEERAKVGRNINVILNRLDKEGIIKTFYKGIYYKKLNKDKIIERKYIKDKEGSIKGYITGKSILKKLGLNHGKDDIVYIVSNESKKLGDYKNEKLKIVVRHPKIKITDENYEYLQLIEIITSREIDVNEEIRDEIIYKYIKENRLSFEKIMKYARETNNKKAMNIIYQLAK